MQFLLGISLLVCGILVERISSKMLNVPEDVMNFIMGCDERFGGLIPQIPVAKTVIDSETGAETQEVTMMDIPQLKQSLQETVQSDEVVSKILAQVEESLEGRHRYDMKKPYCTNIEVNVPQQEVKGLSEQIQAVVQQNNYQLLEQINTLFAFKLNTFYKEVEELITSKLAELGIGLLTMQEKQLDKVVGAVQQSLEANTVPSTPPTTPAVVGEGETRIFQSNGIGVIKAAPVVVSELHRPAEPEKSQSEPEIKTDPRLAQEPESETNNAEKRTAKTEPEPEPETEPEPELKSETELEPEPETEPEPEVEPEELDTYYSNTQGKRKTDENGSKKVPQTKDQTVEETQIPEERPVIPEAEKEVRQRRPYRRRIQSGNRRMGVLRRRPSQIKPIPVPEISETVPEIKEAVDEKPDIDVPPTEESPSETQNAEEEQPQSDAKRSRIDRMEMMRERRRQMLNRRRGQN